MHDGRTDKKGGHATEEMYFHQLNAALIERRRQEMAADRAAREKAEKKQAHWMKCPKCGHDMTEIDLGGIMVDKCGDCLGIFFDQGEIDLFLRCRDKRGFLGMLGKLLSGKSAKD